MPKAKLRFQIGDNSKLDRQLSSYATFSLPSGHSCPGAHNCLARADRDTGRITDGKAAVFRCFSASMEARLPAMRDSRWHNFDLLMKASRKGGGEMQKLVKAGLAALPPRVMIIRHGIGGDFFSQSYFNAWLDAMLDRQDLLLYAYTKSLPYWVSRLDDIPDNFLLTASRGGRFDHLIDQHGLKCAEVFMHPDAAKAAGLEIDHDDSHAYLQTSGDFALLLHSQQRKGTPAAAALQRLKRENVAFSYAAA